MKKKNCFSFWKKKKKWKNQWFVTSAKHPKLSATRMHNCENACKYVGAHVHVCMAVCIYTGARACKFANFNYFFLIINAAIWHWKCHILTSIRLAEVLMRNEKPSSKQTCLDDNETFEMLRKLTFYHPLMNWPNFVKASRLLHSSRSRIFVSCHNFVVAAAAVEASISCCKWKLNFLNVLRVLS